MASPTILCIDDLGASLHLHRALLESKGFRVMTAPNAVLALKLLESGAVDLIIVDYRMEGLDGGAVTKLIKQRQPELPVVILSGYPSLVPEPVFWLVDEFVAKGQPPEVLLKVIAKLLANRQQPVQPAAEYRGALTPLTAVPASDEPRGKAKKAANAA